MEKVLDMPTVTTHVAPKADTKLTTPITRIASKPREAERSHLVDYSRLGQPLVVTHSVWETKQSVPGGLTPYSLTNAK